MNFGESRENNGRARDWKEAVDAIRDAHPGKGEASKYLMDAYGVSRRTAQKWLKGEQAPSDRGGRKSAVAADKRAARRIAANQMRRAKVVAAGKVQVVSKSDLKSAGTRNVGVVQITARARQLLDQAAAALESGADEQAGQLASDAIMNAYGASKGDTGGQVAGALEINEWSSMIDFME